MGQFNRRFDNSPLSEEKVPKRRKRPKIESSVPRDMCLKRAGSLLPCLPNRLLYSDETYDKQHMVILPSNDSAKFTPRLGMGTLGKKQVWHKFPIINGVKKSINKKLASRIVENDLSRNGKTLLRKLGLRLDDFETINTGSLSTVFIFGLDRQSPLSLHGREKVVVKRMQQSRAWHSLKKLKFSPFGFRKEKYFVSRNQILEEYRLLKVNEDILFVVNALALKRSGVFWYLIQDYAENQSLGFVIRNSKWWKVNSKRIGYDAVSRQTVLMVLVYILAPMFEVLSVLANRNIVHMDIKEDNIFITGNGVPKLGDFGRAIQWPSNRCCITSPMDMRGNNWRGTPGYAAPETSALNSCSHLSDTWSLLITFQACLKIKSNTLGMDYYYFHPKKFDLCDLYKQFFIFRAKKHRLALQWRFKLCLFSSGMRGLWGTLGETRSVLSMIIDSLRIDPCERPTTEELVRENAILSYFTRRWRICSGEIIVSRYEHLFNEAKSDFAIIMGAKQ